MRAALAAGAAVLIVPTLGGVGGVATAANHAGTASHASATSHAGITASRLGGAAIGAAGLFTPVNRTRALDTRTSQPIRPDTVTVVRVTGRGQVPATGVVAASVNLTVLQPGVPGTLSVYRHGTSWSGATMSFQRGISQNFETVPVDASGRLDIRNNAATSFELIVDVLGYYTSTAPAGPGMYQPLTPTRLLDTRISTPIGAGQTRGFPVVGRAGIPAGRIAVVVNYTVLPAATAGSLTVVPSFEAGGPGTPSISYPAGQIEQSQLVTGLDEGSTLSIRNDGASAVEVIADVVGYYTGVSLFPDQRFYVEGRYQLASDSRRPQFGAPVPPGRTVLGGAWLALISRWGQPPNGWSAVSVDIAVLNPTTAGSISVWPSNQPWDRTATISFTAGQTRQRMLLMKSGVGYQDGGDIQIRNNSGAPIIVVVLLNGWAV